MNLWANWMVCLELIRYVQSIWCLRLFGSMLVKCVRVCVCVCIAYPCIAFCLWPLESHIPPHPPPTILTPTYKDVEQTGAHSQFYDKFNIRYNISQVMKSIWGDLNHRAKIIEMSKDFDFFTKFVNLLMNDTTYLLDEGLAKLIDIKNIQSEMADTNTWNAKPQVRYGKEGKGRNG